MTFDPTESRAAVPATGEEPGRRRPGKCRFVADLPPDLVAKTMRASNRRRVPMARFVEDALRAALSAEGVAVMLAALAIAVSGCHASAPVEGPASTWDSMVWGSGRWGSDDSAAAETISACAMPARMPCRLG